MGSLPKGQNANEWMDGLRIQSIKSINCSSVLCIMLNKSFVAFHLLYWGIKMYGKLNAGDFSIQWNPPETILCFCCFSFTHVLCPHYYFSNFCASALVSDIFVEANPLQFDLSM